jgi:hypothetical protein
MIVTRALALLLLGYVASVAALDAPSPPSKTCHGDRIVFDRGGELWLLDPGSAARRIVRGGCGTLSPDGGRLAYCAPSSAQADGVGDRLLLRELADGRERTLLAAPAGGRVLEAVWEPQGDRVAVSVADEQAATRVHVVDTRGGEEQEIRFERADGTEMVWGLGWAPSDRTLVVHDMRFVYRVALGGTVVDRVAVEAITGTSPDLVTSSDRFVPSPVDPTVLVFTRNVPGSARFEATTHEPNTAIFIHDRWLGHGKNLRVTGQEITAFDPVWSPDGHHLYFTGYRDSQAKEPDPFRVLRVSRSGQGLAEVARGARPTVGRSPGVRCEAGRP